MGIFPKGEREAEEPGGFPEGTDPSSTRKEEGPGVTCKTEIRGVLGKWRERATDDSHCFSIPLNWIQRKHSSRVTCWGGRVSGVQGWILGVLTA